MNDNVNISMERRIQIDDILKKTEVKIKNGEVETISFEHFLKEQKEKRKEYYKHHMNFEVLGLNDLEKLNILAEDALHELRFHSYLYSEDGDYLWLDTGQRAKLCHEHMENNESNHNYLEFKINEKIKEMTFQEVVYMSHKEIIETYIKDYLCKFRGMMRKGSYSLTPYVVSDEVSDAYLDNLFALRYKENLKLWTKYYETKKENVGIPAYKVKVKIKDNLLKEK